MRILQVNKFIYRRGGAEGYMLDLATLLRGDGHTVEFFGMQHPRNDTVAYEAHFPSEVAFDAEAVGLAARSRSVARMMWSSTAHRGIAEVLDDFRPDVIHAHNVYHQLSPSVLRPGRRRNLPTVMTVHDYKLVCPTYQLLDNGRALRGLHPQEVPPRGHEPLPEPVGGLERADGGRALAPHRARGSTTRSTSSCARANSSRTMLVRGGLPEERVRLLRNFADPRNLEFPPKAAPGSGFLAAGRLAPEKGIDLAIRATAAAGPDMRLRVAGEGPEEEACARSPTRSPRDRSSSSGGASGRRCRSCSGRAGRPRHLDLVREPAAGGAGGLRDPDAGDRDPDRRAR